MNWALISTKQLDNLSSGKHLSRSQQGLNSKRFRQLHKKDICWDGQPPNMKRLGGVVDEDNMKFAWAVHAHY